MTAVSPPQTLARRGRAAGHVAASNAACDQFFTMHADTIARACQSLAVRFEQGGRLLPFGSGAQASDVAHVVVEFLHPVIVGKRALPAVALSAPAMLDVLGRPNDALMVLCAGEPGERERSLLARAKDRGILTLALTGATNDTGADFHFSVPSSDPLVVQETHEMLYHVLWELVHVFLDHGVGA